MPVLTILAFVFILLVWWNLVALRREVAELAKRVAKGAAKPEKEETTHGESRPKDFAKKEIPVPSFSVPSTQPEIEVEAMDFLPRAKLAEPTKVNLPKKEVVPPPAVVSTPDLPIDEFKLKRLDFDSVLAHPSDVGLSSLADKTEIFSTVPIASVEGKIDLVFDGFGDFVAECGADLSRDGMFVKSDRPLSIGEKIQVEVRLRDGLKLMEGKGEVTRRESGTEPGVEIRFTEIDEDGRRLIEKIVAQRERA